MQTTTSSLFILTLSSVTTVIKAFCIIFGYDANEEMERFARMRYNFDIYRGYWAGEDIANGDMSGEHRECLFALAAYAEDDVEKLGLKKVTAKRLVSTFARIAHRDTMMLSDRCYQRQATIVTLEARVKELTGKLVDAEHGRTAGDSLMYTKS